MHPEVYVHPREAPQSSLSAKKGISGLFKGKKNHLRLLESPNSFLALLLIHLSLCVEEKELKRNKSAKNEEIKVGPPLRRAVCTPEHTGLHARFEAFWGFECMHLHAIEGLLMENKS